MAVANTRTQQIVIRNPEPGVVNTGGPNTITQVMEVGTTGIINAADAEVTSASKVAQAHGAIVFPTSDPMVLNAGYWSGSTMTKSSQAT